MWRLSLQKKHVQRVQCMPERMGRGSCQFLALVYILFVWEMHVPCVHLLLHHVGAAQYKVVANSSATVRILETSHPPTFYIPKADVQMSLLHITAGTDGRACLHPPHPPLVPRLLAPLNEREG